MLARSRRSRLAAVALGLAAALCAPVAALADEQLTASPSLAGTLGGPGVLTVDASAANTLGGLPSPLTQLVIDIPPGPTYNFATTPLCPPSVIARGVALESPPTCPPGSQVGAGTGQVGADIGSAPLNEPVTFKIYLTSHNPVSGEVWGNGIAPIRETLGFPWSFPAAAPPFAHKIVVNIPPIPTTPGGPDASILSLHFTVGGLHAVKTTSGSGAHRRTTTRQVGLFDLPKRCPGGSLNYAATASFEDTTTASIAGKVACP